MILIYLSQTIDQLQRRHECKNTELQETKRRTTSRRRIEGAKKNFNSRP